MSKAIISEGQARELVASLLTDVPWKNGIEGDIQPFINLSPVEKGKRWIQFLQNGCRLTVIGSPILEIDRAKPFDPEKFMGKGWTIWKGTVDGDGLSGEEEQDKRSLAINQFDCTKIVMQTGLEEKETVITGEVKMARLVLSAIQADAKIAQTLYEEPGQKTLRWMYDTLKVSWFEFMGTTLRSPDGGRCALDLYRVGGGSWRWRCGWLGVDRDAGSPALGLASPPDSDTKVS